MISISKNLIRNARAAEEDAEDAPPQTDLERLLGTSPPDQDAGGAGAGDREDDDQGPQTPQPAQQQAKQPRRAPAAPASPADNAFAKVPVAQKKAAASSGLSRGLERSGSRHGAFESVRGGRGPDGAGGAGGTGAGGPTVTLDVFVVPGAPALRLKIQGATSVEDVIDLVLRRHTQQKRKPALLPDSDAYEMRMVDDDEGTPDTDMPPLERSRFIHEFNVEEVALCELPGGGGGGGGRRGGSGGGSGDEESSQLRHRTRSSRGVSLDLNVSMRGKVANGVFFIKVRLADHQAYTFRVREEQRLEELLPMIAKKRAGEAVTADRFKFCYVDSGDDEAALGMDTPVGDLEAEELCLVRRDAAAELRSIPELGGDAEREPEHKFTFTDETAREYERFAVVKTNQRGRRQDRVMAIEGDRIHNIDPSPARKDVHRPHRLISDVRSITRLPGNPRAFRIEYRENNDVREYEAETKLECARIVAKVEYLVRRQRQPRRG